MKNIKLYFLVGIVASSSYLLQRALLILSGKLDIIQSQAQPQVQGAFAGLKIPFSYLGMNIYWPFIIAICIFGYKKISDYGEKPEFLIEFEKASFFKNIVVTALPAAALLLHYFSISPFASDQLSTVFGPLEDIITQGQGTIRAPAVGARVASIVIVLGIIASLISSIYALLTPSKYIDDA